MNEGFSIPNEVIAKLYELSGGVDKYKGVVIAACSENGDPLIFSKSDSLLTNLGLQKALIDWLDSDLKWGMEGGEE